MTSASAGIDESKVTLISLAEINPYDRWHEPCPDNEYGFWAHDKRSMDKNEEHWNGALWCRQMIEIGLRIRPIIICRSELVPADIKRGPDRAWFRLDGFKRYIGHKLAGRDKVECLVSDEYVLGPQKHESMTIGSDLMGEIRDVLAKDKYDAQSWPYQGRFQIEDCANETVHVHMGHMRLEFYPDQFLRVADKWTAAAKRMRERAAQPKKA